MIPFPGGHLTIKWRESAVNSRRGDDDGPNRMGCSCIVRHRAGRLVRLHGKADHAEAKHAFLVCPDDAGRCFAVACSGVQ